MRILGTIFSFINRTDNSATPAFPVVPLFTCSCSDKYSQTVIYFYHNKVQGLIHGTYELQNLSDLPMSSNTCYK